MNLKLKSGILLVAVNLFSGFSLSAMDEGYFNSSLNPASVNITTQNNNLNITSLEPAPIKTAGLNEDDVEEDILNKSFINDEPSNNINYIDHVEYKKIGNEENNDKVFKGALFNVNFTISKSLIKALAITHKKLDMLFKLRKTIEILLTNFFLARERY